MKIKILIFTLLFATNISFANNLQITGVAVNQVTQNVTFTLSWDNSWNIASAPNNWDAAWVFVKWRLCTDNDVTTFTHGTLSATTANHSYTNLEAMTSVTGGAVTQSALQGAALDFTDGIMLRRSAIGLGSNSSSVSLRVTNLPASGTDITLSVFGIEMVYVPQGNFYIGDGNGVALGAANRFTDGTLLPGSNLSPSMLINAGFETGASTFYVNAPTAAPGTTISGVPLAFPKGQYGFYIMKHEITEGQYAQFLNHLGYLSVAATARYPGNYNINRNQLNGTVLPYSTTRPDRAQNWLSWADVSAFLDWACLRPMTELEFEKACRGIPASLIGEYPWGNTTISAGLTFTAPAVENGTEVFISGNCVYTNTAFTNGDAGTGPARAGIFATATSTRVTAGASYYGVMDLGGNLGEVVVAMVSDVAGSGGSGVNNVFTRTWGNGAITAAGVHDVAGGWPASAVGVGTNLVTNLVGHRGGSWADSSFPAIQVSDRYYIYLAPTIVRQSYNGGRGVR